MEDLTQRDFRARRRVASNRLGSHQRLSLTPRESEVLAWVARGKSNAQIAEILNLSSRTVQKHLERIFPKIGVENRTAAAIWSLSRATEFARELVTSAE